MVTRKLFFVSVPLRFAEGQSFFVNLHNISYENYILSLGGPYIEKNSINHFSIYTLY